jgi:hypothetical protein
MGVRNFLAKFDAKTQTIFRLAKWTRKNKLVFIFYETRLTRVEGIVASQRKWFDQKWCRKLSWVCVSFPRAMYTVHIS